MASNTNRFSTLTSASADSKDGEKKKDMWNSMLESVASGKRLPEKNLLVLGESRPPMPFRRRHAVLFFFSMVSRLLTWPRFLSILLQAALSSRSETSSRPSPTPSREGRLIDRDLGYPLPSRTTSRSDTRTMTSSTQTKKVCHSLPLSTAACTLGARTDPTSSLTPSLGRHTRPYLPLLPHEAIPPVRFPRQAASHAADNTTHADCGAARLGRAMAMDATAARVDPAASEGDAAARP